MRSSSNSRLYDEFMSGSGDVIDGALFPMTLASWRSATGPMAAEDAELLEVFTAILS
eukprot:CAMPEP_0182554454 /NCGR_PEP_ID=MMETSP1323-20130603/49995_1 /TAXON_ID=236787 /ORGANISM="Florenciella parvula, Strain RCC1693" /LENGTH=56 /DNA_ID=CAMNT_0024766179 /DNA_START=1115 /DNA_END=1281 /DNA_ORIENTATION=+